jgi:hypothetical protein
MKYTDLGDNGPDFIREMDSQGYTGSRDSADNDASKKEYYGKVAKPNDVAKQGLSHLHKALDRALSKEKKASPAQVEKNKARWAQRQAEKGVAEAEEDAFVSKLSGLKSWQVVIMNNYYRGKYSDYSGRYYYVLATSPEEARQVVLDNADAILQDLLSMKSVNGKKILPRGSAIAITDKRIGEIKDGTEAGRMTTAGFKRMFGPQGPMMVKLSGGAVVDVQSQEQGVSEGFKNTYSIGDRVDGPLGTGTIVAVSPNINVDGEIKVKLDDPSRAGEDGKERDTFVLNTTQVKHIADEASLAQMRDYFNQVDTDSVRVDRNYDAPSKKPNPLGVPPEIQALVNKMYHAGKISPQEFEVLRKFQQKTKINVGIREADKNPYAIGMAQAMKSTGDKPPLKKSTINKAHEIARAIKKDQ